MPRTCWCGAPLPEHPGAGRPREYCSPEHYRRIVRTRRLAACARCGAEFPTAAKKPVCRSCRQGTNAVREHYDELVVAQDDRCAICGRPETRRRLSVDHCHTSDTVRELLCTACNWLLGLANDNPSVLRHGGRYLREHRTNPPPLPAVTVPAVVVANDATRRYEQILAWRNEGMVFKEIGRRLGVSKQRAVQLWQQAATMPARTCWCGAPVLPTGESGKPSVACSPGHRPHPSGLLSWAHYAQMVLDQEGRCAICAKPEERLTVDRDPELRRVRELLCANCDKMLGLAGDSPEVLDAGADYVERHARG